MHISFAVLVECNMKQMRIGSSHASIYRHKNRKFYCRHRLFVTSTIPFNKLLILCLSAQKIWLSDNQPLIIKLPEQYKNKECLKINNSIYSDNSVG